jgi:trehalose synthase
MLKEVRALADDRVLVLTADDPILVNALQRRATVVLQKSIREGFGLTVTEAMWKGHRDRRQCRRHSTPTPDPRDARPQ